MPPEPERDALAPSSSSGIFSNVFTFVSREFESFVANAVGAPITHKPEIQEKVSQRLNPTATPKTHGVERTKKKSRQSGNFGVRIPRSQEAAQDEYAKVGKAPVDDLSDGILPNPAITLEYDEENLYTPMSPPLPRVPRRRSSISMPGSLFPRSSSLEPESPHSDHNDRRVRFVLDVATPPQSHTYLFYDESEAGPSQPRRLSSPTPKSPMPSSPLRARAVPSVKSAVQRFSEDDIDPSILLPAMPCSPGKSKSREGWNNDIRAGRKGKEALCRPSDIDRLHSPSYPCKDKSKAIDSALDFLQAEISSESRMKGKEQELVAAREEQRQKERRWERDKGRDDDEAAIEAAGERDKDKERIRMLEEEIVRLKEELSKRPVSNTTPETNSLLLPSPPPPPPPPPPLPSASTTPNHVAISVAPNINSSFASARAALKRTEMPAEAPINGGIALRAKRQGQPTVNVPSDKMAAFLTEMKTVRLRKVTGGVQCARPGLSVPSESNGLWRGASANANTVSSLGQDLLPHDNSKTVAKTLRSFGEVRIGEKRKRDQTGGSDLQSALHAAFKRRSIVSCDSKSLASTSTTTSSSQTFPSSISIAGTSCFSQSYPPPSYLHPANRTWPSISTETDLMTPSLCSDNDMGPEGETSLEEVPLTPTIVPLQVTAQRRERRDVVGVEIESEARRVSDLLRCQPATIPSNNLLLPHTRSGKDLFAKRPPSSPMPVPTPRKPRPPSRANDRTLPSSRPRLAAESDEDDPLSLSFPPIQNDSECKPPPSSREALHSTSLKRQSSPTFRNPLRDTHDRNVRNGLLALNRRRPTLDEELRDATFDEDDLDLDSGILTGVGTKGKRTGFLAHGGAGGAPIFMGVGYIEGAEGEEIAGDNDDDEDQPKRPVKKQTTVKAKRKSKRQAVI